MADSDATQLTQAGHEIPVPSRGDVFRDLAKVAKAQPKPARDEGASDGRGSSAQEQ